METPENDAKNYRWKIFYYNPEDARVTLPKPKDGMGVQLNFAHRGAWVGLAGALAFFAIVLSLISTRH